MAHSPIRNSLIDIANNNAGDPMGFLEGLSDTHVDWHGEIVRTYGFLLFHHRVVRYFKAIVNNQIQQPVVAFTASEFEAMGMQEYADIDPVTVDELGALVAFSLSLETWHNAAHSVIGNATGVPMLDARQNIFFRPFWQLHLYVDGLFQIVLGRYENRWHPNQFVDVSAVAGHIEVSHHGWVPSI